MPVMANTVSKRIPKHLMEKHNLLRYAATKGKTRIEIEYDSDSEEGWMNVFIEDYKFTPSSLIPDGTSDLHEMEEKKKWLRSIGAAEFPEPIKYIYKFPEDNGAFNLSERYIEEHTLEELKAQYEKNKEYVQEVIRSRKSQDIFHRGAEPI